MSTEATEQRLLSQVARIEEKIVSFQTAVSIKFDAMKDSFGPKFDSIYENMDSLKKSVRELYNLDRQRVQEISLLRSEIKALEKSEEKDNIQETRGTAKNSNWIAILAVVITTVLFVINQFL